MSASARARAAAALGDRRGTAAVEFAIVGLAFVLLVIGIMVFGWSMHCESSVRLALEASGRALEINPNLSQAGLSAIVTAQLQTIADPNVTITTTADTSVPGVTMTKITGTYNFSISLPFMPVQNISFQQSISVPATVS